MSDTSLPEVFADGIVNVSHANGVFRITFGQQEQEGVVKPTLKLMLPANQINPVILALSNSVQEISDKIKQQTESIDDKPKAPAKRGGRTKKDS